MVYYIRDPQGKRYEVQDDEPFEAAVQRIRRERGEKVNKPGPLRGLADAGSMFEAGIGDVQSNLGGALRNLSGWASRGIGLPETVLNDADQKYIDRINPINQMISGGQRKAEKEIAEISPEQVRNNVALGELNLGRPDTYGPALAGVPGTIARSGPSTIASLGVGLATGGIGAIATEGALSAGAADIALRKEVEQLANEDPNAFIESTLGRKYLKQYKGDYWRAVEAAAEDVALRGAPAVGSSTALLAKFIGRQEDMLGATGALRKNVIRAALEGLRDEGLEEAAQSAAERLIQNTAMVAAGGDKNILNRVPEEGVIGLLSGAPMGGGITGGGQAIINKRIDDAQRRLLREQFKDGYRPTEVEGEGIAAAPQQAARPPGPPEWDEIPPPPPPVPPLPPAPPQQAAQPEPVQPEPQQAPPATQQAPEMPLEQEEMIESSVLNETLARAGVDFESDIPVYTAEIEDAPEGVTRTYEPAPVYGGFMVDPTDLEEETRGLRERIAAKAIADRGDPEDSPFLQLYNRVMSDPRIIGNYDPDTGENSFSYYPFPPASSEEGDQPIGWGVKVTDTAPDGSQTVRYFDPGSTDTEEDAAAYIASTLAPAAQASPPPQQEEVVAPQEEVAPPLPEPVVRGPDLTGFRRPQEPQQEAQPEPAPVEAPVAEATNPEPPPAEPTTAEPPAPPPEELPPAPKPTAQPTPEGFRRPKEPPPSRVEVSKAAGRNYSDSIRDSGGERPTKKSITNDFIEWADYKFPNEEYDEDEELAMRRAFIQGYKERNAEARAEERAKRQKPKGAPKPAPEATGAEEAPAKPKRAPKKDEATKENEKIAYEAASARLAKAKKKVKDFLQAFEDLHGVTFDRKTNGAYKPNLQAVLSKYPADQVEAALAKVEGAAAPKEAPPPPPAEKPKADTTFEMPRGRKRQSAFEKLRDPDSRVRTLATGDGEITPLLGNPPQDNKSIFERLGVDAEMHSPDGKMLHIRIGNDLSSENASLALRFAQSWLKEARAGNARVPVLEIYEDSGKPPRKAIGAQAIKELRQRVADRIVAETGRVVKKAVEEIKEPPRVREATVPGDATPEQIAKMIESGEIDSPERDFKDLRDDLNKIAKIPAPQTDADEAAYNRALDDFIKNNTKSDILRLRDRESDLSPAQKEALSDIRSRMTPARKSKIDQNIAREERQKAEKIAEKKEGERAKLSPVAPKSRTPVEDSAPSASKAVRDEANKLEYKRWARRIVESAREAGQTLDEALSGETKRVAQRQGKDLPALEEAVRNAWPKDKDPDKIAMSTEERSAPTIAPERMAEYQRIIDDVIKATRLGGGVEGVPRALLESGNDAQYAPDMRLIEVSMEAVIRKSSPNDIARQLAGITAHEILHAMRRVRVLDPGLEAHLFQYLEKAKIRPEEARELNVLYGVNNNLSSKETWLEGMNRAFQFPENYGEMSNEEVVAEFLRAKYLLWARGQKQYNPDWLDRILTKTINLIRRIGFKISAAVGGDMAKLREDAETIAEMFRDGTLGRATKMRPTSMYRDEGPIPYYPAPAKGRSANWRLYVSKMMDFAETNPGEPPIPLIKRWLRSEGLPDTGDMGSLISKQRSRARALHEDLQVTRPEVSDDLRYRIIGQRMHIEPEAAQFLVEHDVSSNQGKRPSKTLAGWLRELMAENPNAKPKELWQKLRRVEVDGRRPFENVSHDTVRTTLSRMSRPQLDENKGRDLDRIAASFGASDIDDNGFFSAVERTWNALRNDEKFDPSKLRSLSDWVVLINKKGSKLPSAPKKREIDFILAPERVRQTFPDLPPDSMLSTEQIDYIIKANRLRLRWLRERAAAGDGKEIYKKPAKLDEYGEGSRRFPQEPGEIAGTTDALYQGDTPGATYRGSHRYDADPKEANEGVFLNTLHERRVVEVGDDKLNVVFLTQVQGDMGQRARTRPSGAQKDVLVRAIQRHYDQRNALLKSTRNSDIRKALISFGLVGSLGELSPAEAFRQIEETGDEKFLSSPEWKAFKKNFAQLQKDADEARVNIESLHQAMPASDAPFLETEDWARIGVSRMLWEAATEGADGVAIPTGETVDEIQGNDMNPGRTSFYEKDVVGMARKAANKMGVKLKDGGLEDGSMVVSMPGEMILDDESREILQWARALDPQIDEILIEDGINYKSMRRIQHYIWRKTYGAYVIPEEALERIYFDIERLLAVAKYTPLETRYSVKVLRLTPEDRSRILRTGFALWMPTGSTRNEAKKAGYLGDDIGEGREWVALREKAYQSVLDGEPLKLYTDEGKRAAMLDMGVPEAREEMRALEKEIAAKELQIAEMEEAAKPQPVVEKKDAPFSMSRRGFLKGVGAVAGAAASGAQIAPPIPFHQTPEGLKIAAALRELTRIAYGWNGIPINLVQWSEEVTPYVEPLYEGQSGKTETKYTAHDILARIQQEAGESYKSYGSNPFAKLDQMITQIEYDEANDNGIDEDLLELDKQRAERDALLRSLVDKYGPTMPRVLAKIQRDGLLRRIEKQREWLDQRTSAEKTAEDARRFADAYMSTAERYARAEKMKYRVSDVLVHGSGNPLVGDGFDTSKIGSRGPSQRKDRAFFFTKLGSEQILTKSLTGTGRPAQGEANELPNRYAFPTFSASTGPNNTPVFTKANMKTVNARGRSWWEEEEDGSYGKFVHESIETAIAEGYGGVILEGFEDGTGVISDQYAIFSPQDIRSIHAAFDEDRASESALLAMAAKPNPKTADMERMAAEGRTAPEMAEELGVPRENIRRILQRRGVTVKKTDQKAPTERDEMVLRMLIQINPLTNRFYTASQIAKEMTLRGYPMTKNAVIGVANRARKSDVETDEQRAERLGIPVRRLQQISARKKPGEPTVAMATTPWYRPPGGIYGASVVATGANPPQLPDIQGYDDDIAYAKAQIAAIPTQQIFGETVPKKTQLKKSGVLSTVGGLADYVDKQAEAAMRALWSKGFAKLPFLEKLIKGYYPMNDIVDQPSLMILRSLAQGRRGQAQDIARRLAQAVSSAGNIGVTEALDILSGKKSSSAVKKELADDLEYLRSYLTTADEALEAHYLNLMSNNDIRNIAVEVKDTIDKVGQMMVRHHFMHPKQYKRWRRQYLRRMYMVYFDTYRVPAGIRMSGLHNTRMRKNIPDDTATSMGQITDLPFLIYMSVELPLADMATATYLNSIAEYSRKNPDAGWVLPESMVTYGGSTMSRYTLSKSLAFVQGEILRKTDELEKLGKAMVSSVAARRIQLERTELRRQARAMEALLSGHPIYARKLLEKELPDGYRQIPLEPRTYGEMAGALVRSSIFNDITGAGEFTMNQSDSKPLAWFKENLGNYNRTIKFLYTVANPPTHLRNFYSNLMMLAQSGTNALRVFDAIRAVVQHFGLKKPHPAVEAAIKHGSMKQSFTEQDIRQFDEFSERVRIAEERAARNAANARRPLVARGLMSGVHGAMTALGIIKEAASAAYGRPLSFMYQWGDSIFKIAKIIDEMERGTPPAVAAMEARKWFFDYSSVPVTVRWLRNSALAPFVSYLYFSMGATAETIGTAPWRLLARLQSGLLMAALFTTSVLGMGVDGDDDGDKDLIPTWLDLNARLFTGKKGEDRAAKLGLNEAMVDRPFLLPVPWRDKQGRHQWIDFGQIDPMAGAVSALAAAGRADIQSTLSSLAVTGGPIFAQAVVTFTGVDPFTGYQMFERDDPEGKKTRASMQFLIKSQMPPLMAYYIPPVTDTVGGPGWEATMGTGKNKLGQETQNSEQLTARLFGFNTYPSAYAENVGNRLYFLDLDLKKAERDVTSLYKNGRYIDNDGNLTRDGRNELRNREEALRIAADNLENYAKDTSVLLALEIDRERKQAADKRRNQE